MAPDPEFLFLYSLNLQTSLNGIALIILLFCSALVSGTEVAFFSLSQTELNKLSKNGKKENIVVKLLQKPRKLLATILITNNFINILIVLLFASLSETLFNDFDSQLNLYFFSFPVRFFFRNCSSNVLNSLIWRSFTKSLRFKKCPSFLKENVKIHPHHKHLINPV